MEVRPSPDLSRVALLPWKKDLDNDLLAQEYTQRLRLPGGQQTLSPLQARALYELEHARGLLCILPVGAGKTLVSLLAQMVVGARRPLLVIEAGHRTKTLVEEREYAKHWSIKPRRVLSYSEISGANNSTFLDQYSPDLVIMDECHRLKNTKTAGVRRMTKFARANPETIFVALSGTITSDTILDFAHISRWALGDGSPLPLNYNITREWSYAVDEGVSDRQRLEPGALQVLCGTNYTVSDASDTRKVARDALRRRILGTPGVISAEDSYDGPLTITGRYPDLGVDSAISSLTRTWRLPDGHDISEASELAMHAMTIACGFYYKWDPAPPDWWLIPRRNWYAFEREILSRHYQDIDSPKEVRDAVEEGRFDAVGRELYDKWLAVEERFSPNRQVVWLSDKMLRYAADWMEEHKGIVWTPYVAFGVELSKLTGYHYYASQGISTTSGRPIELAEPGVPCIASVSSNKTGRNLQRIWSRNLVVRPSGSNLLWEQLIGRTHRPGQTDDVYIDVVLSTEQQKAAFDNALGRAIYTRDLTGQNQKLLKAKIIRTEKK